MANRLVSLMPTGRATTRVLAGMLTGLLMLGGVPVPSIATETAAAGARATAAAAGVVRSSRDAARPVRSGLKPRGRALTVRKRPAASLRTGRRAPLRLGAKAAAALIAPGTYVYLPIGHAVAGSLVDALIARAEGDATLTPDNPIHIVGLTNVAPRKLYANRGTIVPHTPFIGTNNRDAVALGQGDYIPTHLSRVPRLMRERKLRVDVVIISVSPPDAQGYVTLGASTGTTLAALDVAKLVIAEVNPNVPRTHGAARIHQSRIDVQVASTLPLRALEPTAVTPIDEQIAHHVLALIPARPTLQFGIGATTDAIAEQLARAGRRDLSVHSEMISDGTMKLATSGSVVGKIRYSFALGSQAMLRWMHNNRQLVSGPSDVINDPRRLALIKNLISINTALRVDLHGQANAQYVGDRHYSGIGGQQDFFRGAMMSEGGKAILALPSTSTITGPDGLPALASRIVFALDDGDVVTTGMNDVQYIVTEYGVADLEGKSARERAEALIQIAHPDFRAGLRAQLDARQAGRTADVEARAAAHARATASEVTP